MRFGRALPLAAMLMAIPVHHASAQFGAMPGMPGAPGFGGAPAAPPPECQQLIGLRDEVHKHGTALQAAGQRKVKPSAKEVCKLFQNFLASETKMMKAFEENGPRCGVPPQAQKQLKDQHGQAQQVANKVCEAAAQADRPAGPSLSDALGMTPSLPDGGSKKGAGTFDTLSGSPLAR